MSQDAREISEISSFSPNTSIVKLMEKTKIKTIGISPEAYEFLKSLGRKGDTFTDCILTLRDAQK
jgi:hypothetical protein